MKELSDSLSKTRKQKSFPDLKPLEEIKEFRCAGSYPIHQSTEPLKRRHPWCAFSVRKGILCVDVHKTEGNRVVTGGVDTQAL